MAFSLIVNVPELEFRSHEVVKGSCSLLCLSEVKVWVSPKTESRLHAYLERQLQIQI